MMTTYDEQNLAAGEFAVSRDYEAKEETTGTAEATGENTDDQPSLATKSSTEEQVEDGNVKPESEQGDEDCVQCSEQNDELAADNAECPMPTFTTKEQIVTYMNGLVKDGVIPERIELDKLKQIYYRLNATLAQEAYDEYIAAGGEADAYQMPLDDSERDFKEAYAALRSRRARQHEEEEQQKEKNLARKEAIIERIKALSETADTADKNYNEFKELQAEWKEIKAVPAEKLTELWKNYQFCVELFYDQLKINREARELDFKKNLEGKTAICEEAEKLAEAKDVVAAFNRLQELHQEYREIGPVDKEQRELLWSRFKAASTTINRQHQDYFEQLKAQQEENLTRKTALCEKIEAMQFEDFTKNSQWDALTDEVKALQSEWKTIGFTPKKVNSKIYERFRAACNKIFSAKTEYYKKQRNELNTNLQLKQKLLQQAEELKDSTDWSATTNRLIDLQKEWKSIGAVPHKQSDAIWKKFHDACNYFFERKEQEVGGKKREEEANLEAKNGIIRELEALIEAKAEDAKERAEELLARWREIGFVPFKQKDKINEKFKEVADRLYDEIGLRRVRNNVDRFAKNVASKVGGDIERQRERLYRAYETKRNEIKTFETNLTFLTTKSKNGSSLLNDMQRNMEKLKQELELLKDKIETLDAQKKDAQAKKTDADTTEEQS